MSEPLLHTAVQVLGAVCERGESLAQLLPPRLASLEPADRGRLQDWCYGSCRWWFRLEGELASRLREPLRGRRRPVHYLLLLALYQLRHTDRPPHAVVNEAVTACRALGQAPLANLVNGVLRRAQREGEPETMDPVQLMSHPQWMVDKLRANWPADWGSILAANNGHPPMVLRVNGRRLDRDAYLAQLQEAGVEARPCDHAPRGIRLARPLGVDRLPGFGEGLVSVQDEAAQLCVEVLEPVAGERVLDACAAPGGKTAALLEAVPEGLDVTALDVDGARLRKIHENLERLDLQAAVLEGDGCRPEGWWDGRPFDRILLDAPCSATGVIRRHPDIKLLRRPEDIAPLASRQLALLEALWPLLAPGGRLVYATCSVFMQENQRLVERFLQAQPEAVLCPLVVDWGLDTGYGRQLLPRDGEPDGFFYAALEKKPGQWIA